jgi:NADPH-dependent 2,4-dienoyl-CoA reductase/sulfur reductase-like enzyme
MKEAMLGPDPSLASAPSPEQEDCTPAPVGDAPHVVIVGAGFGGLACAKALGRSGLRVTIIDQRNYHLFACSASNRTSIR